jgi:hypothetical protein
MRFTDTGGSRQEFRSAEEAAEHTCAELIAEPLIDPFPSQGAVKIAQEEAVARGSGRLFSFVGLRWRLRSRAIETGLIGGNDIVASSERYQP